MLGRAFYRAWQRSAMDEINMTTVAVLVVNAFGKDQSTGSVVKPEFIAFISDPDLVDMEQLETCSLMFSLSVDMFKDITSLINCKDYIKMLKQALRSLGVDSLYTVSKDLVVKLTKMCMMYTVRLEPYRSTDANGFVWGCTIHVRVVVVYVCVFVFGCTVSDGVYVHVCCFVCVPVVSGFVDYTVCNGAGVMVRAVIINVVDADVVEIAPVFF
jgi:hypothetical protein